MAKKITQYPASGGNPDVGSLIDISELSGGVYTSKKLTIEQLLDYLTANLDIGTSIPLHNNTGATIPRGTPVQIGSGITSLIPNLKKVTSSDATNDGKIFIPTGSIINGAVGNCIESGMMQFFSSYANGDKIFWNITTQDFTNVATLDDQIFIGIIVVGSPLSAGKMFVAPRFSPSLVKGASGQIPLFLGERKLNGNTHFTFVDNAGVEVGFRFSDNSNNLTQVGVTYLNVESEGIASNSVLRLANWSDNTNKGIVSFRKARGSKASPTKVTTNDVLGTMIFAGASEKNIDGTPAPMSGMTTGEVIVRALNDFIKSYDSFGFETFAQGLTQFEVWLQGSNQTYPGDVTPPNTKVFSVNGDGKVYFKNYNFPINAGTNGQTLVTDALGNLSWANGGGISGGGVAGKIAFWNSATNVSYNNLIDVSTINEAGNGSHARIRVGSSDTAQQFGGVVIYKGTIFQSTTGETISSTLTLDTINQNNAKTSQLNLTYEKLDTDDYTLIPCINTNILGEINFQGYEPYGIVAFIKSILTENQTTGNKGNKLVFSTIINGTATPFNILILDGDGRVKISDAYKLPLLDGASGTSLITDGGGNVSWGTPSASASTSMQTIGRNSTGAILRKGTVVSISGSTGNRPNFVKAQANAESTSAGTFGIVVSDIANNSDGYVATIGTLSGLDTRAVATNPFTTDTLVDGDTIYLSPTNAGYVTNVKPSAPNHLVYIGKVVQTSPTNGTIVYRIQNGYELDEIHDVAISGVANDDVLQYESATGLWKNKPLSTTSEDIWKANPNETYRGISLNNNSTTVVSDGGVVMSTTASTLAQSVGSSYFALKQIRLRYYASVVSAGRYTGTRGSALLWYLHGGFRFVCDFNISDTAFSAGCQQFYGLANQTTDLAYGGVSGTLVSTLINAIGVGSETNDANLQVFHNDASGTCTKIDLGASFPANRTSLLASTTVYQIQILNVPSSSTIQYKVINKETGAIASGTISTNLPDPTTGLNFFASRCMSTISSVTNSGQFDLMKLGVYSML